MFKNTFKNLRFWLPILGISISLALATPIMAADLSPKDAQRLLNDTKMLFSYLGLKGESDYAAKPENIIKAALFGCFDAKMSFNFEQEERKEAGKAALPKTTPLFKVNGKAVTANQVLMRDDAPNLFKNVPESFTCFIVKDAIALGALYFTGHSIKKHTAPKGNELLGDTLLNDKGYYVSIEGLGDAATESELKKIKPQGEGFVLTGKVVEVMDGGEEQNKAKIFRLELKPGEAPGTWKRQYIEKPIK